MSIENPAVPLSTLAADDAVYEALTGSDGGSGVKVNRKRALGHAAIWRGVNLIAGDIGRHAFRVYRYQGDGLLDDPQHQAARVLRRPNGYMTSFTFRQIIQAHALISGNGYALIVRDGDGVPLELLPLNPDRTYPVRANGVLYYVAEQEKTERRGKTRFIKLDAADVLHIKGLGFDGLCGYSVIRILYETIGGTLAARDYGARYFANNAAPGVVLEVPAGMTETAVQNLRRSWGEMHQGVDKAHRPAILRDGVKLVPFTANARDAQLIENREFDNREIANVLGVPPHKLGDPSRTAYNSLESENQAYHEDTLGRWFAVWEQECDSKLLTEEEKDAESHTCRFDPRPMARVSLTQRASYYAQGIMNGWLNVDEVRGYENLNPLPDGAGKVYRTPLNLGPAAPPEEPTQEQPTTTTTTDQTQPQEGDNAE